MPTVIYEKRKNYAVITLNRPERMNALNAELRREMTDVMDDFTKDPEMRAGILTGAGRAFSAGADLRERNDRQEEVNKIEADFKAGKISDEQRRTLLNPPSSSNFNMLTGYSSQPKPMIAAINGVAVGGGTEIAIDCDIRIISTEGYMGLWEAKRGFPAGSGVINLPRVMNFGDAMYIMMTCDKITPEEALRFHLVHEVTTPERLIPRAIEIAEAIASCAPMAIIATKTIAQFWRQYGRDDQQKYQSWIRRWVDSGEDSKEGPKAFAEKRQPVWKNR